MRRLTTAALLAALYTVLALVVPLAAQGWDRDECLDWWKKTGQIHPDCQGWWTPPPPPPPPPPVTPPSTNNPEDNDDCPNIGGWQGSVPEGMVKNAAGDCVSAQVASSSSTAVTVTVPVATPPAAPPLQPVVEPGADAPPPVTVTSNEVIVVIPGDESAKTKAAEELPLAEGCQEECIVTGVTPNFAG